MDRLMICLIPIQRMTPEVLDELRALGAHNLMALSWTPSPWWRAFWVKEGEDHMKLEVKWYCYRWLR